MLQRKIGAGVALALVSGSLCLLSTSAANAYVNAPSDPAPAASATDWVAVGSDTTFLSVGEVAEKWNALTEAQQNAYGDASAFTKITLNSYLPAIAGAASVAHLGTNVYAKRSDVSGSGAGLGQLLGTKQLWSDPAATANEIVFDGTAANDPATANVDVARSSGGPKNDATTIGLSFFPFAFDEIGLAVSGDVQSYAPASLTKAQVKGIFTGVYTNWSQVGGTDAPIAVHFPPGNSGTGKDFAGTAAGPGKDGSGNADVSKLPTNYVQDEEHSSTKIKSDPTAIAPFSTGRAAQDGHVAIVTISDGPVLQRAVYNVVRNAVADDKQALALFGPSGIFCDPAYADEIELGGLYQLNAGSCGVAIAGTATTGPASLAHAAATKLAKVHPGPAAKPVVVVPPPVVTLPVVVADTRPAPKTRISKVFKVPAITTKVRAKVLFSLSVKAKKKYPAGKITVVDTTAGKTVGRYTLKTKAKGKAAFALSKLKKGKHKLVFTFTSTNRYVKTFTYTKIVTVKK